MEKIEINVPKNMNKYFNTKVWRKAFEIYRNNQIISVKALNEKEIIAQVQGTACYTVTIKINNDQITMNCNCPYWENCKHEAAVLLYLRDNHEVELTNQKISPKLSELDEFRLFLSSVQYDLDSDEDYRHDNDAYNMGINDCVDYIENCNASREEKLEMLFLLIHNFNMNRMVCSCFMKIYQEDYKCCEDKIYSLFNQEEIICYELSHLGNYIKKENEKALYRMLIEHVQLKLNANQINTLKESLMRHQKAWEIVEQCFNN